MTDGSDLNGSSSPQSITQKIEALDFEAPGAEIGAGNAPTGLSAPGAPLHAQPDAPWWHSQFNLMLCVFGLLAAAALLFVALTPPPEAGQMPRSVVASDGSVSSAQTPAATLETPWDESRRAQARTDSQDILSELLASKKALEAKGVTEWAPDRYKEALELAELGDNFYKQQDFVQAIQNYQAAAENMSSLNDLIPQILDTKIKQGLDAIAQGKSALAKQRFNEALVLDRNNISAMTGLGRANTLDQVLDILNSAIEDEQLFVTNDELASLQSAEQKYKEVLAVDSRLAKAQEGAQRVALAIQDKQYRLAMSKGFNALFAARHASAKKAFSNALKLKPGDATASAAYQQSLASDRSSSLSSLLANGKRFEKSEAWAKALSNYQAVLQRDPNQVSAKLGVIRSRARNELDEQLETVLADPLSLSTNTQKDYANRVLNDARSITKKGARLQQQIANIENSLKQSDTNVKVTFESDKLTKVTLLRSGARKISLGAFASKNLALKPGRYVLNGKRLGFRDVRQEIELLPGSQGVQRFNISCIEPIAGTTQLTNVKN